MYTLDEQGIERYMAQIVVLAVSRPSAALDRLVVDLCRRSLRLACKVGGHQLARIPIAGAVLTPYALRRLPGGCKRTRMMGGRRPRRSRCCGGSVRRLPCRTVRPICVSVDPRLLPSSLFFACLLVTPFRRQVAYHALLQSCSSAKRGGARLQPTG